MSKVDPKDAETCAPTDLREALAAAPSALAAWGNLTPIGRRDFMSWIKEAKLPETRQRRIERCCENLVKGKRRPCCYAVVPMDLYKALGADPVAKTQWSSLTADEKRDFSDWIEDSPSREERKGRVKQACSMLTEGNSHP